MDLEISFQIWMKSSLVNNVLQGKFAQAGNNGGRFLMNSTVGLGGFFDIANKPAYSQEKMKILVKHWLYGVCRMVLI